MNNGLYALEFLRDGRRFSVPEENKRALRACISGGWEEEETNLPIVLTAYLNGPELMKYGLSFRLRSFLRSIPKWIHWDSLTYCFEVRDGTNLDTCQAEVSDFMTYGDAISLARKRSGVKTLSPRLVTMSLRRSYSNGNKPERLVTDEGTIYLFFENPDVGIPLGREKFIRVEVKRPSELRPRLNGSLGRFLRVFGTQAVSKKTQGYLRIKRYLDCK
ncbi:hypothetical protein HYT00_02015 [Candidatus Giovannonibacteria bacterium]|nr:hypothetical protein [Candidatus Giovannonibacteria bacterium]